MESRAPFADGRARPVQVEEKVALREDRRLRRVDILGLAGRVVLRAAPAGTGIIAGGPMRAVFESLGVHDVVAKSQGSSNPYNMIRATFEALKVQSSPRQVAAKRGKKVSEIVARRADGASEVTEAGVVAEAGAQE